MKSPLNSARRSEGTDSILWPIVGNYPGTVVRVLSRPNPKPTGLREPFLLVSVPTQAAVCGVNMKGAFSNWIARAVILKINAGDDCVPLRGVIMAEMPDALRFRIGDGWDVDIYYKSMVLALKEENWASLVT